MTRRAKERRALRIQDKQRLEQLEAKLGERSDWKRLLDVIDNPPRTATRALGGDEEFIDDELKWQSTQTPIAAAASFQLPIKLDARRGTLHYDFQVEEYDIDFSIQMVNGDGELREMLPSQRYERHNGRMSLQGPGLVLILFDNSFSWVNAKQLAYAFKLRQEMALDTPDKRIQFAQKARRERTDALDVQKKEMDRIKYRQARNEGEVVDIENEMKKLQERLDNLQSENENLKKQKEETEMGVVTLQWEVHALNWRALETGLKSLVLSYLDKKSLAMCSMVSRRWKQDVEEMQSHETQAANE